jgi:hypothetical protein
VFCARVEDGWPADAEIIEDVPVAFCRRRGVAIDLVVERARENRSQFVFTRLPTGREGIFWQTRKVVSTARPGARIPGRRASGITELPIVVDTRERYPYRFARHQATTERAPSRRATMRSGPTTGRSSRSSSASPSPTSRVR